MEGRQFILPCWFTHVRETSFFFSFQWLSFFTSLMQDYYFLTGSQKWIIKSTNYLVSSLCFVDNMWSLCARKKTGIFNYQFCTILLSMWTGNVIELLSIQKAKNHKLSISKTSKKCQVFYLSGPTHFFLPQWPNFSPKSQPMKTKVSDEDYD